MEDVLFEVLKVHLEDLNSMIAFMNQRMWAFAFCITEGYDWFWKFYEISKSPELKCFGLLSDEAACERVIIFKMFSAFIMAEDIKLWLEGHTEKVMWVDKIRNKQGVWTELWWVRVIFKQKLWKSRQDGAPPRNDYIRETLGVHYLFSTGHEMQQV